MHPQHSRCGVSTLPPCLLGTADGGAGSSRDGARCSCDAALKSILAAELRTRNLECACMHDATLPACAQRAPHLDESIDARANAQESEVEVQPMLSKRDDPAADPRSAERPHRRTV